MPNSRSFAVSQALGILILLLAGRHAAAQILTVIETNVVVRVMAANLTSGNSQSYEGPGIRILQGLKPDVVAIQEFKYANSSSASSLRQLVDLAFGTNFYFYCEPAGAIPNGIVSRWPILASGSWDDPKVSDRGYAWARIDLPGTNDLYVVSVHLYSSGTSADRNAEALALKGYVTTNLPQGARLIVAGDLNTTSRGEAAVATFKTFLSDEPIPADQQANPNTNEPRSRPYDYVLPSFSLTNYLTAVTLGNQSFAPGLVFDSARYTPLADVSPVLATDSHVFNMQHMGVLKAFRMPYYLTNSLPPAPLLSLGADGVLRWTGTSNVTYYVQSKVDLNGGNWFTIGSVSSADEEFSFTNTVADGRAFYRLVAPGP